MIRKEIDVVALGELLIDFAPLGKSENSMPMYECNPGGAPANVLTVCSRMGLKTAFIGKVGEDMFGAFLKETLEKENIDTNGLVIDEDCFTTLAFVALSENGERSFSFARKPGADTRLDKSELNRKVLENCKVLHVGSLSLTDEPARSATFQAIHIAKSAGALISYDPNYRAPLWQSKEKAVEAMKSVLPYVDFMKASEEEAILLTGEKSELDAAAKLISKGIKMVSITMGSKGSYIICREGSKAVLPYPVKAVDTTGAGDAFWGGVLTTIIKKGKDLADIRIGDFEEAALFGNAVASICVESRGAIPAMPYEDAVRNRMKVY